MRWRRSGSMPGSSPPRRNPGSRSPIFSRSSSHSDRAEFIRSSRRLSLPANAAAPASASWAPSSPSRWSSPTTRPASRSWSAARSRTSPTRASRSRSRSPAAVRRSSASPGRSCMPEAAWPRLADLTTLRLGGPARELVRAPTEAELWTPYAGRTRRAARCSCSVVAATSWSATRVRRHGGRASRPAGSTSRRGHLLRRRRRHGRGGGGLGRPRRARGRRAAGSASRRSPASPGSVGATPIQNVGAYGQEVAQTIASVRVWDRRRRGRAHLRRRRLRLRLPHQPVQGATRPLRRARRSPSSSRWATSAHRSGTPSWPAPWASSSASAPLAEVREAVLRLRARQGHGARRRRTTTPGAPARSSPTRCSTRPPRPLPAEAPRWPQPDGTRQDQRRLADRAGRLRQGLRQPTGRRCPPSTRSR